MTVMSDGSGSVLLLLTWLDCNRVSAFSKIIKNYRQQFTDTCFRYVVVILITNTLCYSTSTMTQKWRVLLKS